MTRASSIHCGHCHELVVYRRPAGSDVPALLDPDTLLPHACRYAPAPVAAVPKVGAAPGDVEQRASHDRVSSVGLSTPAADDRDSDIPRPEPAGAGESIAYGERPR